MSQVWAFSSPAMEEHHFGLPIAPGEIAKGEIRGVGEGGANDSWIGPREAPFGGVLVEHPKLVVTVVNHWLLTGRAIVMQPIAWGIHASESTADSPD